MNDDSLDERPLEAQDQQRDRVFAVLNYGEFRFSVRGLKLELHVRDSRVKE